jgi:serine/threonine protein kinase
MKESPHPLIAKLIDNFIDSDGHQCLVLERYNDGDFSKYLNDRQGELLSEKEILRFLANIFLAVFHINS